MSATIRTFIGPLVVIVFLFGALAPAIAHFGNGEGSDDDDSDHLDGSYYKAGGPETYDGDGDADDSDSDDDDSGGGSGGGGSGGSGGGSSSAPDVPSAYQLIQLANRYTDARGSYAATRVRFEALAATAAPPAPAEADVAVDRLQVAEERVVSRLTRLEEATARNARVAGEARETAVERARVSTSMTAGDPVAVATGTFITSETDVSFRHGGIEVAARRRYRSGAWPTGSFGLWTWPYDSRIIRGVTPGAEEAAAEADAALSVVAAELSTTTDALARAFGEAAVTEPAGLEADLSGARSEWSVLSDEVGATRDAARATLSAADFLDASHSDWRAPEAYRQLSTDVQALLSDVELRLSRADDRLAAFREARRLHSRLLELESDIAEVRARIRARAQSSRRAREANRHALLSADPAYLERTGAGMLTVIDERGAPQVYRVSEGAAGDAQAAGD
ncbi:MAG: DUF6531 domain-containing protein, partial [Spirochaetia bacterium]